MKIIDFRCAVIGKNPVVRIVTDAGIDGYGEAESYKPYLRPHVLALRDALIGEDPTDVERVMLRIRSRGAFKPWGSAISAVEHALWDIAGKAAGLPVYRLLGGKMQGTRNGLLGLAALVQVSAALPHNFIAFEYPTGDPAWWYDIVDGLPDPIVKDGMIEVWDRPGMGVDINPEKAKRYLSLEDARFFD